MDLQKYQYDYIDDDGDLDIDEDIYDNFEVHNLRFYISNIFGWVVGSILLVISLIGLYNLQFTSIYMLFCSLLFIPPVGKVLRKRMRRK
ncbi:hypothetical protein J6E39_00735 [bacterium]|nr:hypothetical protein [bacterium]